VWLLLFISVLDDLACDMDGTSLACGIHCQELTWAPDVDIKLQLEKILREWLALLISGKKS
jgi:hypothetical protein